jgi:serine phosphatase RsbU (regulator of sigma subunit)
MSSRSLADIDHRNEVIWQSRYFTSPSFYTKIDTNLLKAEEEMYQRGIAYAKLNLAAANFYRSKNDVAFRKLTEAFKWFENNLNEKGYVRALLLKGLILESFGDYEKSLRFCLEACKVSSQSYDRESEGEACSQLGLIYSRLSNHVKSLEFFNKSLIIREEIKDENAVASSLNRIGMVLRQMKRYDESLGYYFRSLEIRKRNGQKSALPWTLLGIASTYEEMKNYPEALNYFERGSIDGDKRCTLQCIMGLGRIYSQMGEPAKAEERLRTSLLMARELKSHALIAEAYSALSANYELFKKHEKALKYFKQYLKAKELSQSSEVQSRLSNIEIAYAIEKSENEKEIHRLRHIELRKAYNIIEEKNREIIAGINSAKRIQRAILPGPWEIRGLAGKCFILNIPKDIVSGDFYWFAQVGKKLVIAAADCTDHGVPGSLMTMLGVSFLDKIVKQNEITDTNRILDQLRYEVKRSLHQTGKRDEEKNGMDISLCTIDIKNKLVQYSGANINLWLFRNKELTEYKADRMPIGIYEEQDIPFSCNLIQVFPGDMIYMRSDGFQDQYGGRDHKKFKTPALKSLLSEICLQTLETQRARLESEFLKWKGDEHQTDDVLIIGLRI